VKLLYQTHSPYARKALVFAHEAGLANRIEVLHCETSPTVKNAEVFAQNPLGKVPVLLRDDGPPLFDSDIICAYLDSLHSNRPLIPAEGEARWHALQIQAAAQGLADSGIALRWETVRRPEHMRYPPLADGYALKLVETYDWLEATWTPSEEIDVGQIALATTLDWLVFRNLPDFRAGRPTLASWFDAFVDRASMRATPLFGETQDATPPV
jgi:glutathione S-transferase